MKKEKYIALNKMFIFFMTIDVLFSIMTFVCVKEGWIGGTIGFGIITVTAFAITTLFVPCCYVFDEIGVSIVYIFLSNERYLWKKIRSIEIDYKWGVREKLLYSVFNIFGESENKNRFYMISNITKTLRTQRLIKKYWNGTIKGYLFEDTKAQRKRKKEKKVRLIKQHFTDEIVPMERKSRAKIRSFLTPFIKKASDSDFKLSTEYFYVTKDGKHYNSRPKCRHNYAVRINLTPKNGNTVSCMNTDLIYVNLSKTGYVGTENDHALKELQKQLESFFDN